MNKEELKMAAAAAAAKLIQPGMIVGVGTGSTANHFISLLRKVRDDIKGVVSSSKASTAKLQIEGIPILELNSVDSVDIYIDGADEFNYHRQLIKGGGGALTGEKIIAAMARRFICIVDQSKEVNLLGRFPLPVEVIPLARSYVARELVKLGGKPVYRHGVVTDYGNLMLDVHNLNIIDPVALEGTINNITGVVTVGLFARRSADQILVGSPEGVRVVD